MWGLASAPGDVSCSDRTTTAEHVQRRRSTLFFLGPTNVPKRERGEHHVGGPTGACQSARALTWQRFNAHFPDTDTCPFLSLEFLALWSALTVTVAPWGPSNGCDSRKAFWRLRSLQTECDALHLLCISCIYSMSTSSLAQSIFFLISYLLFYGSASNLPTTWNVSIKRRGFAPPQLGLGKNENLWRCPTFYRINILLQRIQIVNK